MALVEGTNCGFVLVAPTADPLGDGITSIRVSDNRSWGSLFTSPNNISKITEIGWWCDNDTEEANFEVGIYTDDENDEPETRIFVDTTNAKGTSSGWKTVSVDWDISTDTDYWIAVQLDNVSTTTNTDFTSESKLTAYKINSNSLTSDWGTSTTKYSSSLRAIYALYEEEEQVPATISNISTIQGVSSITI